MLRAYRLEIEKRRCFLRRDPSIIKRVIIFFNFPVIFVVGTRGNHWMRHCVFLEHINCNRHQLLSSFFHNSNTSSRTRNDLSAVLLEYEKVAPSFRLLNSKLFGPSFTFDFLGNSVSRSLMSDYFKLTVLWCTQSNNFLESNITTMYLVVQLSGQR